VKAEIAILFYALFSWRAKPHTPCDAHALTNYKRVGQVELLNTLPLACVVEIIPVHLLLQRWNEAVAWIMTGLSVYALIWMVELARSFRLRPTILTQDYVWLRYGLMFEVKAPRRLIACIRRADANDRPLAVPRKADPTHCIDFVSEVIGEGLFGVLRRLTRVALTFDDPVALERALAETSD
jgi:hypothetical protein